MDSKLAAGEVVDLIFRIEGRGVLLDEIRAPVRKFMDDKAFGNEFKTDLKLDRLFGVPVPQASYMDVWAELGALKLRWENELQALLACRCEVPAPATGQPDTPDAGTGRKPAATPKPSREASSATPKGGRRRPEPTAPAAESGAMSKKAAGSGR